MDQQAPKTNMVKTNLKLTLLSFFLRPSLDGVFSIFCKVYISKYFLKLFPANESLLQFFSSDTVVKFMRIVFFGPSLA